MKLKHLTVALIAAGVCAPMAYAENLVQVYNQALTSDPTFALAHANWLDTKENLPIAQAALLPSLDAQGTYLYTNTNAAGVRPNQSAWGYNLSLQQTVFNYAEWKAVSSASDGVKSATATFSAAQQDLIFRTAQAYFNVLKANDQLRYTSAEKNALYSQLRTNQQKYKVGLIPVTSVYEAQAQYDAAVAQEIKDQNGLENSIEDLRAITGVHYKSIAGFRKQVPLTRPVPSDIGKWVNTAEQQNYTLKADEYSMLSAKESIGAQAGMRYPNLTLNATYGRSDSNAAPGFNFQNTRTATVGATLDFPFYQGGLVSANTRQAEAQYLEASSQLELDHRTVVNNTRQNYLGVSAGISKVQADYQAIVSSRKALAATRAGYTVGTRTMVDVLDALSTLYQNQTTYANDQYSYIINVLKLKQDAGTLSVNDLHVINQWLTKEINLSHVLTASARVKHVSVKPIHKKVVKKATLPTHTTHVHTTPIKVTPVVLAKKPASLTNLSNANVQAKITAKPAVHHHAMKMPAKPPASAAANASGFYAVQFFAGDSALAAYHYKENLMTSTPLDIYKVTDGGKTLYKVVYGHYSSHAEAAAAAEQLPLTLQSKPHFVAKVS